MAEILRMDASGIWLLTIALLESKTFPVNQTRLL